MDEIALLAREIVRRGWTGPAVFLLESLRPLGGIAAAGCDAAAPLADHFPPGGMPALFGRVVSERGGIERLLDEIERLEQGG